MRFEPVGLPGAWAVHPRLIGDARGNFSKTFHAPTFAAQGLRTDWVEDFMSSSTRDVVRGLHFQVPPADHAKLVYCIAGSVIDVLLDLRTGSPTQGQHRSLTISADNGIGVYIPTGIAHGFVSTSEWSTMAYKVTSVHSPEHDRGIAFDSIEYAWPTGVPLVSDRDRSHPPLDAFDSPFVFDAEQPGR